MMFGAIGCLCLFGFETGVGERAVRDRRDDFALAFGGKTTSRVRGSQTGRRGGPPHHAATEGGDAYADALGLPRETTWAEAAKQLGRRLYIVDAMLEMPEELYGSESMFGAMTGSDGQATDLLLDVFHERESIRGEGGRHNVSERKGI